MDAEIIGKWVALAASIVAAGQAGTTWVDGYSKEKISRQEAQQNVELAAIKERSELSKTYLEILLESETDLGDRILVFDALGGLDGHPLQAWAKKRSEEAARHQQKIAENTLALQKALEAAQSTERDISALKLEAERLAADWQLAMSSGEYASASELRNSLENVYKTLSDKNAEKAVADIQVASVKIEVTQGQSTSQPGEALPRADGEAIVAFIDKVTPTLLYPYFSEAARGRIDENYVYLQNAFKEFQVSDPRLIAITIATLAVEVPGFNAYEEPEASAKQYEGSQLLGNVKPGDGLKFRGRGYVGITGRQNYSAMAKRLGLPSLLEIPEDAAKPEVASRIALAWIMDRKASYLASIESNDFIRAGRLVRGGRLKPVEQERYEAIYSSLVVKLTDT